MSGCDDPTLGSTKRDESSVTFSDKITIQGYIMVSFDVMKEC